MPTGTAFTNTSKVFNGTRYCYQVSATNSIGESAKSTTVCVPALTALPAGFTTSRQSAR
jgi:orotate phosphoribosyltransferase